MGRFGFAKALTMGTKKKIVAICGSTRANSSNLNLINAIKKLTEHALEINLTYSISNIPHFNPDLDTDKPPQQVKEFRTLLTGADGILICTPEYAMGVPGTLKNAIDWTVSSCEFSHKPTVLITASSIGARGHDSLLETLKIIEAGITNETQLLISHVKTKVSSAGEIIDLKTKQEIETLMDAFIRLLKKGKLFN